MQLKSGRNNHKQRLNVNHNNNTHHHLVHKQIKYDHDFLHKKFVARNNSKNWFRIFSRFSLRRLIIIDPLHLL